MWEQASTERSWMRVTEGIKELIQEKSDLLIIEEHDGDEREGWRKMKSECYWLINKEY